MNRRLTWTSAMAVVLASTALFSVLNGGGWLAAGAGAAVTVALAGTLTRQSPLYAAIGATVLALIASVPLLDDRSWHLKLAGLAIVAVTATSATRLKALPVFAGAVTYLASLLIYVTLVFSGAQALARIVPTASSLHHLRELANQGWQMRAFAPPVADHPGVTLLAAAGIGLMAVATDLLAVRLRSPAIAGLPLLVLFSVPITTSAKPAGLGSAVTFCLGVIGYLAMLAADGRDRLRIWGRLITVWHGVEADEHGKGPDTRALAAAGRRIGVAAVGVAVVVPLLIPLHLHGLFAKHPTQGGSSQILQLPAPIDQMKSQLTQPTASQQTVLTYTTTYPVPARQYLPIYVMNLTTAGNQQSFALVPPGQSSRSYTSVSHAVLPFPPGQAADVSVIAAKTRITTSKSLQGYSKNFLPVPYAPASVSAPGTWLEDNATLMIYSTSAQLAGLAYTVNSQQASPTLGELDAAQTGLPSFVDPYKGYNGTDAAKLASIAHNIINSAHAKTAYQKAQALAAWFSGTGAGSGGFTYNLHPQWLARSGNLLDSGDELVDFLTVDRTGYCQQFAYAMAILARLAGIPARLAVGYTAGTPEGGGVWKVTDADAHAWPELFFKNIGWLRFEPTPGGSGGQDTAEAPVYPSGTAGPGGGSSAQGQQGGTSIGKGNHLPNGGKKPIGIPNPDIAGAAGAASQHRGPSGADILLAVVILLALALITPAAARPLTRRRRWRRAAGDAGLAHAAWQELRDDMDDYGLACRASESPRALARRVGATEGLSDPARQALNRIAHAEERARYAVVPEPAGTLRADVLAVRRSMSQNASPGARWRAWLLPASMLEPVRAGVQHSLDVFGWMDAAGQRVRRPRREALSRPGA